MVFNVKNKAVQSFSSTKFSSAVCLRRLGRLLRLIWRLAMCRVNIEGGASLSTLPTRVLKMQSHP